jgi:WD40 repeat protein/tRNA A-37 threonylcarbamoyl transferase component Bud32
MNGHDKREETLFNAALKLATPEERAAYLKEACPDDEPLRQRVLVLLHAHDQADAFLDKPAAGLPARTLVVNPALIQPTEKAGDKIGRYKLLQQIGEGGCGVVYMADQEEPVRRRVALKIIKQGMDTKQVIARFEAERQALALMDHPNIAKVLDAGATETGRPYFVMELVRGIRITDYCDQNNLSTRERLNLFNQVCNAIQHAHQKGIIHRDIKPSNILVTMHDGVPVPKVIDFGIAKATEQRLTDKTLFTAFEQFMGTPAYMSPEQAEMSGLDIDTRSDIYSLGVLLYELLTGKTPFDAHELLAAGLDAMRRTIREKEPARPSTCLSTMLNADLTTVAKHRQSDAPKLIHLLRGDLDWVVMKALEKDRTRRYETANGLAMDLQRHLNNEPVVAAPPSWSYLLSKTMRKHRRSVTVASALAILLVAGTTVSLWQAARASKQAGLAEVRRREADLSRQTATEAQSRAEGYAKEVSHQLAHRYVEKGAQLLDANDYFGSLVWFTEALRLDQGNPTAEAMHRIRIGAVLQQSPKLLAVFPQHKREVVSVEFSPDGRRLVAASFDGTARVWDAGTAQPVTPPLRHAEEIWNVNFSSDGQRVVTASSDHTAQIWDATTGLPLTPPLRHEKRVFYAVFSPDGRRVASTSEDKTARVWDALTGQPVTPPLQHADVVLYASFSPDGQRLVTTSFDHTARIWNAETGQPVTPALQHTDIVGWATFSPDGRLVVTTSQDHTARIWDAHTGVPVGLPLQHSEAVTYAAFSSDGKRLVTASGEAVYNLMDFKDRPGEARVWDVATGKPLTPPMQHTLGVFQAIFSPDNRYIATASRDRSARVWDANTGEPVTPPLQHNDIVFHVAFSPNGGHLATASADCAARIWDVAVDQPTPMEVERSWLASGFSFNTDGRLIAGIYLDGTVRVWNALTGTTNTPHVHTNVITWAISPDDRMLATAGADRTVRVWDAKTGAAITPPLLHDGDIRCVAFSPDSQRLITASADNMARIWNANTGVPLTPPLQHASTVLCAAFSPDGRRVATASEDQTARVWDANTGAAMTAPLPHSAGVSLVVFSPDSGRVLTATKDGRTRIWDALTGGPITPPIIQEGDFFLRGVETMSFSPDGHRFVIADSNGRTARVWNADTGVPITPPLYHDEGVLHAAFSHDGRYVLTTVRDKTVRVWDATTGQPITPPLQRKGLDDATFTADDQAVKIVCHGDDHGTVETWNLAPDNRPTKELIALAQGLSIRRVDASGVLVPLDFESLTNTSWTLHQ